MMKMKSSRIFTLTCAILILSSMSLCLVPPVSAAPPYLTISKVGPLVAYTGQTFSYTITLHNTGDADAVNVILNDTLPAGVQYVGSNPVGTYDPGTHTVAWNFGPIGYDGTVSPQVTVRVDPGVLNGTVLTNVATVRWHDQPGNPFGPENSIWETVVISTEAVGGLVLEGPFATASFLLPVALAIVLALAATIIVQRNRSSIRL
jgi:uncharacterized repeat protein (TIGR01451 family)